MQIYVLTNTVNGKGYVGQTKQTLTKRLKGHVDKAKYSSKWKGELHRDILKFGRECFEIRLLERVRKENADEAEIRWMKELKTLFPNGYNIREGGLHAPMAKSSRAKLKGRTFSEEHKRKLAKAAEGRPLHPNARKGLAVGWKLAKLKKGARIPDLDGEGNPNSTLTKSQVLEIRKRYSNEKISQEKLAEEYGIKQVTVSAIVRRRIWKYV